jgi:hypothetical protein
MKLFQRGAYRKTNMIGLLALSLGVLVMLPSLSPTDAQFSKQPLARRNMQLWTMGLTRLSS